LGPYSKLPLKTQNKAKGLIYFLLENDDGESEAEKKLREAVEKAGVEIYR